MIEVDRKTEIYQTAVIRLEDHHTEENISLDNISGE